MAGQRDNSQERTEQATPKRRQEAKRKGQVARSRELSTVVVLLGGALGTLMLGSGILDFLTTLMERSFTLRMAGDAKHGELPAALMSALGDAVLALAPLMMLLALAAVLAPLAVGGWSFSTQAVAFKWEKIDPLKGLRRIFSAKALMELFKALAKFVLVAGVAALLLWQSSERVVALNAMDVRVALAETGDFLLASFVALSAVLLLVAALDVPFQLWDHARQLRMTRQEVRDELKETEGKPEVKSRVRQLQRELAQRRMMEEVPKADVVVVNPTHYAVALRYAPQTMAAPRLVAKGADLLAARIRETANQHGVPVVRAPALARAVYYHTRVNHEVPTGLYVAVAHVLAYVFRLRRNPGAPPPPLQSEDLPIPDELRRDRAGGDSARSDR